jgi:uncharacterized protein (DUF983 family)
MATSANRDLWPAVLKGMKSRCPHCGKGHMFRGFLKVADTCSNCGEELKHARADDFPPYITITIVGHIVVAIIMHFEMSEPLSPMMYMITMLPVSVIMSLVLLRPIKGAIVGMQWASRMHGFSSARS